MKLKDGVIIAGLKPVMRKVLIAAEKIWLAHGQELVITSGLEGAHSAGSYHYYGYALDFRTRYFSEADKDRVFQTLKKHLTEEFSSYKVIQHKTHVHVHWEGLPC